MDVCWNLEEIAKFWSIALNQGAAMRISSLPHQIGE